MAAGFPSPFALPDPAVQKIRTARTTIAVAGSLALLKAATWVFTASSGVLGSALDSFLDLVASLFVLWAVVGAARPPDADHPWGHGKFEGLASVLQSLIIFISGVGLALESWHNFESEETLKLQGLGIGVMAVSIGVTIWWVSRLREAARLTGSPALEADSVHYASDVLLNSSVMVGLLLSTVLDGARWPDLVVSLGIAGLILFTAVRVFRRGVDNLVDTALKPEEAGTVLDVVTGFGPVVAGFHDLRSRRSGSEVFLEIHLDLDRGLSFVEAHDKGEEVRVAIEAALPRSRVTVHTDPL